MIKYEVLEKAINIRPKKILLSLTQIFLPILFFCDLENRYPDAGEFCTPMREVPECVQMDFRNKILSAKGSKFLDQEKIELKMINRVEYEYERENTKLQVDVLSEHRIRIRTIKLPESSLQKEETYIRVKGPKISLWTRIKNWQAKKD